MSSEEASPGMEIPKDESVETGSSGIELSVAFSTVYFYFTIGSECSTGSRGITGA